MIGKHEGFVALLRRELPNPDMLMSFHCILHQQSLCAKSALLSDPLNGVIVSDVVETETWLKF